MSTLTTLVLKKKCFKLSPPTNSIIESYALREDALQKVLLVQIETSFIFSEISTKHAVKE